MTRSLASKILLIASGLMVIGGLAFAGYGYRELRDPLKQYPAKVLIEIEPGTSFAGAVDVFAREGLVRSRWLFATVAKLMRIDRRLKHGRYAFEGLVSQWDVIVALKQGKVVPWEVLIREGQTMSAIRDILAKDKLMSPQDFDRLVRDATFMQDLSIDAPSLEGYLFPDTYFLQKGMEPEQVLKIMVKRMRQVFDEPLRLRAQELSMTEREVLTLASIIERETGTDAERPIISAVFHNRLRRGIPLQSDPTAIYGVKSYKEGVTARDVRTPSAYNTYFINGLPPGPIAAPGLASIKAVLYPADVPYLYFVSNNDGTHKFSSTLKEHERAVNEYRKKRAMQKRLKGRLT